MKPFIAVAKVPLEAGMTKAIQIYFDNVNDKKVVLQCENGNWVYDADTNSIVPLLGKNSNVVVRNGKVIRV